MTSTTDGPISWRNWRAQLDGAAEQEVVELKLYSDAWFIADFPSIGPYAFLNGVPRHGPGGIYAIKPSVILRARGHLAYEQPDLSTTQDDDYHGGWHYDEIAALCALLLDARIVAGPIDREFERNGDPLGRPIAHAADVLPALPHSPRNPQIPRLLGNRDLRDLSRLQTYPHLPAKSARALIKSCRLYQQALWIADTSPQMAWLLLVSAIETVASDWDKSKITAIEMLERSFPDLAHATRNNSDPNLLGLLAEQLQNLTRPTGKFIGFVNTFSPKPPSDRPLPFGRLNFSKGSIKAAMAQVYGYRSRALHSGTPFPDPMCWPPEKHHGAAHDEIPIGLAAGSLGSSWLKEDMPLLLHTFAYIARETILNWWNWVDSADPQRKQL